MPLFSTFSAIAGQVPSLNPAIGETIRSWVESVPQEVGIVIAAVTLIAFLIGRLSVRRLSAKDPAVSAPGTEELQWRHEKLVLLERQDSERRSRQEALATWIRSTIPSLQGRIKMGLSDLAEEAREIRQRIGTDHSRFSLLKSRLETIAAAKPDRPEAIQTCIEMSDSQLSRLEAARDQMRPVGQALIAIDESFQSDGANELPALEAELTKVKAMLSEASGDWNVLAEQSDRQIRDLLSAGGEPEYAPLVEVLLVDGSVTESLVHEENSSLKERVDDLLDLIEVGEDDSAVALRSDADLLPSTGFAAAKNPVTELNGHHDRTAHRNGTAHRAASEVPLPESGQLVLFRSNDVDLWGSDIYRGANHRARSLKVIPDWAEWISIRRLDTGEAVYVSTGAFSLSNAEIPGPVGFNGSHEKFYGARHLGMFSDACPNEVETRFTYGGWGFGHRVSEIAESSDALQASGWAGKEISADTVFEIMIHAELPELSEVEEVLTVAPSQSGAALGQS